MFTNQTLGGIRTSEEESCRIISTRPATTAESVCSVSSSSSSSAQQSNQKHSTNWRERQASALSRALGKVDDALDVQQFNLNVIAVNIRHHTAMAKARLEYSQNSMGALLSMRTVKALQNDYTNICRLMDGLNQIQNNLKLGYVDIQNLNAVDKAIQEVVQVPFSKQRHHATDEELLQELQQVVNDEDLQ